MPTGWFPFPESLGPILNRQAFYVAEMPILGDQGAPQGYRRGCDPKIILVETQALLLTGKFDLREVIPSRNRHRLAHENLEQGRCLGL